MIKEERKGFMNQKLVIMNETLAFLGFLRDRKYVEVKEEPKINPEIELKSRLILLIYKNKLKSIIKILTWQ